MASTTAPRDGSNWNMAEDRPLVAIKPKREEHSVYFDKMLNSLTNDIYQHNIAAGWYTNLHTGLPFGPAGAPDGRNIPEMLMLIVSEIAEAMEGYRKNLPDDKLPHRKMIEVELADAMIRIFDLAGYMQLDLGGAIAEKRAYNALRADHKMETRLSGGKKF